MPMPPSMEDLVLAYDLHHRTLPSVPILYRSTHVKKSSQLVFPEQNDATTATPFLLTKEVAIVVKSAQFIGGDNG